MFNSQDQVSILKPKSINIVSAMLFALAIVNVPAAFMGSAVILVTNHAMKSIPGGLEYSALRAIPFVAPVSLMGMISLPLLLLAAFQIRSGSQSAWKISLCILVAVLVGSAITSFLTTYLISPIYSITSSDR